MRGRFTIVYFCVPFQENLQKVPENEPGFPRGFTSFEVAVLVLGMAVAFIVSVAAIRGLMKFVQKHDFKPFGWYRIALGALVLILFFCNVLKL
mgnify:FL=1